MADGKYDIIRAADAQLRSGNMANAIAGYRRALSLDPAMGDVWYNMGYALRFDGQFTGSLDAYAQALARGVDGPEGVHVNRAAIFSEQLNAFDEAREELSAALCLNPDFVPAWLNLGMLHEDLGQTAEARNAYAQVMRIDPQNGRAMARLTAIALFYGEAPDMILQLEKALRSPTLAPKDAVDVAFALANAYDATERYEQAFALALSANQAQHQHLPVSLRYDPAAHERLIDALCALRLPPPLTSSYADTAAPIFICGLFRSGSTLAEQLLARHSEAEAGGEYDFIPEIVRLDLQPYPAALEGTGLPELEQLRRDYLSRLDATGYNGGPFSDKRCDNFLHIGLIKSLFPKAKIIHTVRSPLDNAVSLFFQHFADGINYSMDLDHLGHWLAQYRRLMAHWRVLYGPDIHDFNYDQAVYDPRLAVRAMVAHCGLTWRDGSGATKAIVKTASAWQVRQPLHKRSSGRWRNYARELQPVRLAAGIDDEGNWITR